MCAQGTTTQAPRSRFDRDGFVEVLVGRPLQLDEGADPREEGMDSHFLAPMAVPNPPWRGLIPIQLRLSPWTLSLTSVSWTAHRTCSAEASLPQ